MEDGIYPRGAVKRLRLTDFMCFAGTVMLQAGARVNLVEGPNGSGKSSLVTALCVGLAGSMKALGRQTRAEELIRRGCIAFETEITLSGGPTAPDIVVHRRTELTLGAPRSGKRRRVGGGGGGCSRSAAAAAGGVHDSEDEHSDDGGDDASAGGGSSTAGGSRTTWRIDGTCVTEKQVKELARSMGILFDNLCQFLPQERVNEFSNLSPTELLERTEEAIGSGHLLQQHTELKQRSAALKTKQEELQRTQDRLCRVEADQAASEPEYNRVQRRNALQREVEQLRCKVLWLEKKHCAQQLARAREQTAVVRSRVGEARQRLATAKAPLNARTRELEELRRAAAAQAQEVRVLDSRVGRGLEALRRLEVQLRAKEDEQEGLRAKSGRWRVEVARTRQELERVKGERAALPEDLTPEQSARLAALDLEIQQAAGEVGPTEFQLVQKRQEVQLLAAQVRALEEAGQRRQDLREQRLRRLERQLPLSRRLYEWITEMRNAGRFRRRVLGPLLMEIMAFQNPVWAAQLEFVVGLKNLGAVVTEDREDNNLVHRWLEENKRRQRPNRLLMMPREPEPVSYPAGHPSQYAAYGITHTVDQIFEATSDLVKQALCSASSINTAYVGTDFADRPDVITELLNRTPVRKVLTPRTVTLVTVSEYDPTYITQKILDLPRASLLGDGAVQGDEEAEQQQLEARTQALAAAQAEAAQLEELVQQRQAAVRVLQNEKTQLQHARKRLEQKAQELARRESELARRLERLQHDGDPLDAEQALRTALCRDAEMLLKQARDVADQLDMQHKRHLGLAPSELSVAAASASLEPLPAAMRRAEEGVAAVEREAAAAERLVERATERLQDAEARARDAMGGARGPDTETRHTWARWPDSVQELEQLLAEKQADMEQAQAGLRGDEALLLEAWRQREAEISQLRLKAAAGNSDVAAVQADIEARKAAWLPELQGHLDTISNSVKALFASIGCAGEVVLRAAAEHFDKYAVEIRVQYRPQEPLRPLDRNQHSGGERSVATMLYLMALQGVTSTPFRAVDEINQGMDSINERKVFNLLVESSSRPDTPQCFLLTPKLIANLRYNDHVRVLSLKCMPAAVLSSPLAVVARLTAEAEGQAGRAADGGGRVAGQRSRPQAEAVGAGTGLAQLPWQQIKNLLFFGRSAVA